MESVYLHVLSLQRHAPCNNDHVNAGSINILLSFYYKTQVRWWISSSWCCAVCSTVQCTHLDTCTPQLQSARLGGVGKGWGVFLLKIITRNTEILHPCGVCVKCPVFGVVSKQWQWFLPRQTAVSRHSVWSGLCFPAATDWSQTKWIWSVLVKP